MGNLSFLPKFSTISMHYFEIRGEKKAITASKNKAVPQSPVVGNLFAGLGFC